MLSFIKKFFFNKNQDTNNIKRRKWTINPIKIYIAPIKISNYEDKSENYKNMILQAFNIWATAAENLNFEITENILDSNINIDWKRADKKALGQCYFNYDNQGQLYSAEISIGLFFEQREGINYDTEIYHSILHCVGIALGVPQTNNPEDIMCIPHQYGKTELSENDKKAIYYLYNIEADCN